jgi:Right handed beta helix region
VARPAVVFVTLVTAAAAVMASISLLAAPQAAERRPTTATPATLAKVYAAARGKEVIELAAGDYGSFAGAAKPAMVTLRARPGAAVSIAFVLDGASNLRVEHLTVTSAKLTRSTRVEFADNRFTGPALVDTTSRNGDHAIVFEHNTHEGIDVCPACYEGRLTVHGDESNTRPVGVTIRDSFFGGSGDSDGILVGSYGVRIIGNEFAGIHQGDPDGVHTDAIQLYGQSHTLIRGNYLHDVATGIMAGDGADHEVIEDNVIVTEGYPWGIVLGGDDGSIVRRNTLLDGACNWNTRCGQLRIGNGNVQPSHGTVVRDNILGALAIADGSTLAADDHNLLANPGGGGSGDLTGVPVFAGGSAPTSRVGFALAGPLGRRGASDGSDIGAPTRR